MGVNSEDSLEQQFNMNSLILASLLAVATALPIEDTPEVAAAKAEFSAAFAAAEKGEHAALAPVNTDVQAPAPVHVIPEPAALDAAPAAALPVWVSQLVFLLLVFLMLVFLLLVFPMLDSQLLVYLTLDSPLLVFLMLDFMLLDFLMLDFPTMVSLLLATPMLDSQLLLLQLKPRLRNKSFSRKSQNFLLYL